MDQRVSNPVPQGTRTINDSKSILPWTIIVLYEAQE